MMVCVRVGIAHVHAVSYTRTHTNYIYRWVSSRYLSDFKRAQMAAEHSDELVLSLCARTAEMKNVDQQVALSIGGLGGVPTRDRRGNVLDSLWVKYSEQSVVGMLLETNDIRKILLEQIQEQLKCRRDLIQEVEQTEVVCQWLLAFTGSWEKEYSSQIRARFDIGQLILSSMSEAYFEAIVLLGHAKSMNEAAHSKLLTFMSAAGEYFADIQRESNKCIAEAQGKMQIIRDDETSRVSLASAVPAERGTVSSEARVLLDAQEAVVALHKPCADLTLHTGDDAIIRFLFRHTHTKHVMCRIAGALLRKQEVCNRSGGYSAKVQRTDISQQKSAALDTFCTWILHEPTRWKEMLLVMQSPRDLIPWIVDHKGAYDASDGRHYANATAGQRG